MKWIECSNCMVEFKVISDTDSEVVYCPYCGHDVECDDEENYDEDWDSLDYEDD